MLGFQNNTIKSLKRKPLLRKKARTLRSVFNRKSLTLDGTDDYANMGNLDIVGGSGGTGDFSVSAWFKTSTEDTNMHIVGKGNTPRWTMEVKSNDNKVDFELYMGGMPPVSESISSNSDALLDGNWHHCVVTADRSANLTMYIDGSAQSDTEDISGTTGDVNHDHASYPLVIGRYSKSASKYWNGQIDEVAIWDVVLSSADVTSIYNSGKPNNLTLSASYDTDRTGQLVAYWRFEDDYTDSSTNSNTGAAVNEAGFSTSVP